jgi:hypothetical protein
VDEAELPGLARSLDGLPVSALKRETLLPLIEKMSAQVDNPQTMS